MHANGVSSQDDELRVYDGWTDEMAVYQELTSSSFHPIQPSVQLDDQLTPLRD